MSAGELRRVAGQIGGAAVLLTLIGPSSARASGETVDKLLGALPPGKTVVVRFKATVNNPFPINTAQVSTQGTVTGGNFSSVLTDDPDVGGASDPTVTPIDAAPDMVITKTDGATTTAAGQSVVYTLQVTNVGNQGAANVLVSETVPADTTFNAGSSTPGWSCANGSPAGTPCTFALGAVPVSAIPIPLSFAVNVVPSPAGSQIVNTATVGDDGTNGPDRNPLDNTATDTDTLGPAADLAVTKTNGRTQIISGSTTVYTITVTNAGPAGVVGATVTDTPPSILSGLSWTCVPAGGATCAASGTGPINTLVNLPAGSSLVFKLTATLDPLAAGTVANTASVSVPSGTVDAFPGNNSATDTDAITPRAAVGDFDGDGRSDIALFNKVTGEVREWRMNGFVVNDVSVGIQANLNARIVGTGDYDGNGVSDLLWQDQTTFAVSLWMNGTTTGPALPAPPFAFPVVGSGDYDGDGTSDILWQNTTTRELVLWVMGGGSVTAAQSVGTTGPNRSVRASEDYNNDGRSDLFLMNVSTMATQVRFMDGLNASTQQSTNNSGLVGWDVVGTSHFHLDPNPIVVWHTFKAQQPELWMMNGASVTRGFTSQSKTGPVSVVGAGDYDGDGHADILWYNQTSTQLRVWLMNGFTVTGDGKIGTLPAPATDWIVVNAR